VDEVDAAPVGEFLDARHDVLGLVVDDLIGAERADEVRRLGAAHRRQHAGAARLGDLDGRGADAAGPALHEHGLAGLEIAAPDEAVVGGGEDHAQGGGVDERERRRFGHRLRLGDESVLGVAALAADAEAAEDHLVAGTDARHLGADPFHHASAVRAEDLRRLLRRREAALAHGDVDWVHGRRLDAHQDLSWAGLGVGDVLIDEDLGAAVFVDAHRLHRRLLPLVAPHTRRLSRRSPRPVRTDGRVRFGPSAALRTQAVRTRVAARSHSPQDAPTAATVSPRAMATEPGVARLNRSARGNPPRRGRSPGFSCPQSLGFRRGCAPRADRRLPRRFV